MLAAFRIESVFTAVLYVNIRSILSLSLLRAFIICSISEGEYVFYMCLSFLSAAPVGCIEFTTQSKFWNYSTEFKVSIRFIFS